MTTPISPLEGLAVASLKSVFDPELPINIYDLGLIYKVKEMTPGAIRIEMTLTNPHCPVADQMSGQVRQAVGSINGVVSVDVAIVWDPPWGKDKMTEEGKMVMEMLGY